MSTKTTANKKTTKEKAAGKEPAGRAAPAAGPAPAGEPALTAADELAARAYTLQGLVGRIGLTVSAADVRARVATADEQLIELGRQIGSERISVDCARVLGIALDFFDQATPAQRRALLGLSRRTLEVAIWSAHYDATLWQQRDHDLRTQQDLQKLRGVEANTVLAKARGRREQLFEALLGVAGGQPTRVAQLRSDYGLRGTPAQLAQSLRALCQRGRTFLTATDPDTRVRVADTALDEALLKETEALADSVARVGPAATAARSQPTVSQDQVDLWDGYTLTLFERIVRIFTAGRAVDPTVPRLTPIALHHWYFGYQAAAKKAEPLPSPDPAADASGSAAGA